jgi:hypothetical protein
MEIEHHKNCVSHQDEDFCDCDYEGRLELKEKISPSGFGWRYKIRKDGPTGSSIASVHYSSEAFRDKKDGLDYLVDELMHLKDIGDWDKVQYVEFGAKTH